MDAAHERSRCPKVTPLAPSLVARSLAQPYGLSGRHGDDEGVSRTTNGAAVPRGRHRDQGQWRRRSRRRSTPSDSEGRRRSRHEQECVLRAPDGVDRRRPASKRHRVRLPFLSCVSPSMSPPPSRLLGAASVIGVAPRSDRDSVRIGAELRLARDLVPEQPIVASIVASRMSRVP